MRNILILLIIPNVILGQAQNIEEILRSHFIELNNIECNYRQEKELSRISKPLISSGIFKYEKEGTISLQQQDPFKEIFILNKESKNRFDEYINQFIISILNGKILSNPELEINYQEDDETYIVEINPEKSKMRKNIKEIILTFHKEIVSLIQLKVISKNGDINKITFFDN